MSVELTVIEAADLKGKNADGSSDPVVEVTLGKQVRMTQVVQASVNPVWRETFSLDVSEESMQNGQNPEGQTNIQIVVWNASKKGSQGGGGGGKGSFLGQVSLDVVSSEDTVTTEGWYKLEKRSNRSHVNGNIRLKLVVIPAAEVASQRQREQMAREEETSLRNQTVNRRAQEQLDMQRTKQARQQREQRAAQHEEERRREDAEETARAMKQKMRLESALIGSKAATNSNKEDDPWLDEASVPTRQYSDSETSFASVTSTLERPSMQRNGSSMGRNSDMPKVVVSSKYTRYSAEEDGKSQSKCCW